MTEPVDSQTRPFGNHDGQVYAGNNDRYKIVKKLGAGGMGQVCLGIAEKTSREVAVKFLHDELQEDSAASRERFEREIKVLLELQAFRGIVRIEDYGRTPGGSMFFVMEYLKSPTLDRIIEQHANGLPQILAVQIALEILTILEPVHRRGFVHRDLKPQNISVTEDPLSVFLLDFGLSKPVYEGEGFKKVTKRIEGRGFETPGSPHYMAVEQFIRPKSIDNRTDLYAVGVILYELLSGQPPFRGIYVQDILRQHKETTAPALDRAGDGTKISYRLQAVINRALEKDQDKRFQDAGEFKEALFDILNMLTKILRPKKVLDASYRILRKLGQGGNSEVFEAEKLDDGQRVAIKIAREGGGGQWDEETLMNEADRALSHDNIVKVLEFGIFDGRPALIMELMEGGTCEDLLKKYSETGIPEDIFYATIIDCCRGLHHAHIAGMIHRDVKPGNMLRDKAGRTKVCDFGIAKRMEKKGTDREGVKATKMMGTALYMAPEMCGTEDAVIDRKADVYAMGVMMYEMLSGHPPFEDGVLILRQLQDDPPPLQVRGTYKNPDELAKIVEKCMMKEREKRFQTMKELAHELHRVSQLGPQKAPHKPVPLRTKASYPIGGQTTTLPQIQEAKRKNTMLMAGVAVVVVAIVGFAAWKMMNPPPAPQVPTSNPNQLQTVDPAVTKMRELLKEQNVDWAAVKAAAKDLKPEDRGVFRPQILYAFERQSGSNLQTIADVVKLNSSLAPAVDVLVVFADDENLSGLWDEFTKTAQNFDDATKNDKSIDRALLPWRETEAKALENTWEALNAFFAKSSSSFPRVKGPIANFRKERFDANKRLLSQAIDEAVAKGAKSSIDIAKAFGDLAAHADAVRSNNGELAQEIDATLATSLGVIRREFVRRLSSTTSIGEFVRSFSTISKDTLGIGDLKSAFLAVAEARRASGEKRSEPLRSLAQVPEATLSEFCESSATSGFFPAQLAGVLGAEPAKWSKNFAESAKDVPAEFLGSFVGDAVLILTKSGANGLLAQSLQAMAQGVAPGDRQKKIDELKKQSADFLAELAKDGIGVTGDANGRIVSNWSNLERDFVPSSDENALTEVQRRINDAEWLAKASIDDLGSVLRIARNHAKNGSADLVPQLWSAMDSALSKQRPLTLLRLACDSADEKLIASTKDKTVSTLKSILQGTKVTRAHLLAGMPEQRREFLNAAWLNGEGLDERSSQAILIDFVVPECDLSELPRIRLASNDTGSIVTDSKRPGVLSARLVPRAVVNIEEKTDASIAFSVRLVDSLSDLKEEIAVKLSVADLGSFDFKPPTLDVVSNGVANGSWKVSVKMTDDQRNPTVSGTFRGSALTLSPVGNDGTYEASIAVEQFCFDDTESNAVEISAFDAHKNAATPIRIDKDTMNGHRNTLLRAVREQVAASLKGRFSTAFESLAPEIAFEQMARTFDDIGAILGTEIDKLRRLGGNPSSLQQIAETPLSEWTSAVKAAMQKWSKPTPQRDAAKAAWTVLAEKAGAFEKRCAEQSVGSANLLEPFVTPLWTGGSGANPNPTPSNQDNTPITQPPVRPVVNYPDTIRIAGYDFKLLAGTGVRNKEPVWMSTVETSRSFARAAGLESYLDKAKENSSQSNMGGGDGTFNDMTDAYPLCPLTVIQINSFIKDLGSSPKAQNLLKSVEGLGGRTLSFDLPSTSEWSTAATKMQAPGKDFSWESRGSSAVPTQFISETAGPKTPAKFKELQPVDSDPTASPFNYLSGNVSETCNSGFACGGEISPKSNFDPMKMVASDKTGQPSKFRGFRLVLRLAKN